ncbi:MAG: choice-of-anchor Q domain-containing protein [Lysobacterales bacterium]
MKKGIFAWLLLTGFSANAATIEVNTLFDTTTNGDGLCSLREAIESINVTDVRTSGCVAQGPFDSLDIVDMTALAGTIAVSSSLVANNNLAIDGPIGSSLTIEPFGNGFPMLQLNGGTFVIRDLTFANARAGAVSVQSGSLAVFRRSRFLNNQTTAAGAGGAISANGTTLVDVDESYFEGNIARQGGAIYTDGPDAGLVIESSTFNANSASFIGGAVMVRQGQNVTINNATFVGNSAVSSGAALRFGTGNVTPNVSITFSTITDNTGAAQIVASDNSNVTIQQSILSNASNNCNAGNGGTITLGFNSIDDTGTCGGSPAAQVNPLLDPLANNGGIVPTMNLRSGSPAIDRSADCGSFSTDARGDFRPSEGDGAAPARCDVGALEIQGANIFIGVTGLMGSGLSVRLNSNPAVAVSANGNRYLASLLEGSTYNVTVASQPSSPVQVCSVTGASGVAGFVDLTIDIQCVTSDFTVGGTVNGLAGNGLTLTLNVGPPLSLSGNRGFTFPAAVIDLQDYRVRVDDQPTNPTQICSVSNDRGTINGANITDVVVTCQTTVDLSVTKDDGQAFFTPGEPMTYLITVTNNSVDDLTGIRVVDTLPASLLNASWICTPGQNAACTASGNGDIDELVDLDAAASAVFALTASTAPEYRGIVINSAEIIQPGGRVDPNPSNNVAVDESATGQIFANSFEDVAANIARKIEEITR